MEIKARYSKNGKKLGRKLKPIDGDLVKKLALINCTYTEIARVVGCDEDTLLNRFSDIIKTGHEEGKSSLKRKQFEVAMRGNVTMLIWLGKVILGQKDTSFYNTISQKTQIEVVFVNTDTDTAQVQANI